MKHLILATPFVLFAAAPAFADDRPPTLDERVRIETALKNDGYTSWGEIELDEGDNVWEVDDAIDAQGKEWDLELDTQSFVIVKRDD